MNSYRVLTSFVFRKFHFWLKKMDSSSYIDRYRPPFTYEKVLQCFKIFSSLWTYHILCFFKGLSTSCKTKSFMNNGFYYKHQVEINETLAKSRLHCKDLCAKDDICRDYRYNDTTGICLISILQKTSTVIFMNAYR